MCISHGAQYVENDNARGQTFNVCTFGMWSTESSFFISIRWWWFMVISWYGNAFSITHYSDDIVGSVASLITSLKIVYSTVYSDPDHWKHQSSASLAFVWGILPFDDVIMLTPVDCAHNGPVMRGFVVSVNKPLYKESFGGDMTLACPTLFLTYISKNVDVNKVCFILYCFFLNEISNEIQRWV